VPSHYRLIQKREGTVFKYIALLCVVASLGGCATPAQVNSMIGVATVQLADNSPLKKSVQVDNVSGGQATNPLWTSQVGSPEFMQALQQSLGIQGIAAADGARYKLDAVLVELKQPIIGFDFTVTSTVRYTLRETATNRVAFDQTITAEYTATVSDAFIGVERLRLANEGSIKNNLSKFLDQLIGTLGTGGAGRISALTLGFIG
jgi:hypothetical protein